MKIIVSVILLLYGFVMLLMCYIAIFPKENKPSNNVRFYVKAIEDGVPWLYIQRKTGELGFVAHTNIFTSYGLNPEDFANMKKGEVKEVFLNLED